MYAPALRFLISLSLLHTLDISILGCHHSFLGSSTYLYHCSLCMTLPFTLMVLSLPLVTLNSVVCIVDCQCVLAGWVLLYCYRSFYFFRFFFWSDATFPFVPGLPLISETRGMHLGLCIYLPDPALSYIFSLALSYSLSAGVLHWGVSSFVSTKIFDSSTCKKIYMQSNVLWSLGLLPLTWAPVTPRLRDNRR